MALFREIAKRGAFFVLGSDIATSRKMASIRRSGKVTILNLHRVREDDGSGYKPMSPALFDRLLSFLAENFTLVTFGTLEKETDKPKLILSFDDGYKDFIEVTMPILEKHGIRVNHNIIPGCVESGLPPLNVMAQDFIGKAPAELVQNLDVPGFPVSGPNLGFRLSRFLKEKPMAQQRPLGEYLHPQFFAWDGFEPTPMMSLDEVRQAADVHELGGHSFEHANMGYETDAYLRDDIDRCRQFFVDHLHSGMRIYAFPNGSCEERHIQIVQDEGIEHVLLVGNDFSPGGGVHPRFTFDVTGVREAQFKATGGLIAA